MVFFFRPMSRPTILVIVSFDNKRHESLDAIVFIEIDALHGNSDFRYNGHKDLRQNMRMINIRC